MIASGDWLGAKLIAASLGSVEFRMFDMKKIWDDNLSSCNHALLKHKTCW